VKASLLIGAAGAIAIILSGAGIASAQSQEAAVVESATNVLTEFMSMPNEGIPRSMLANAQGLVIVPAMVKVGLVAGIRHGKGIAVIRDDKGVWRPPTFVTMTGGSVGWQVGIQSTDVILVFNTRNSVTNLLRGKFTVGVDAAAAAGPIGRQASAATDARLQAEIFSYSRSRGLFAGASVDGSVLQTDTAATRQYYNAAGLRADGTASAPNAQFPPSTTRLLATLAAYAPPAEPDNTYAATNVPATPPTNLPAAPAAAAPGVPVNTAQDSLTATRLELVQAAQELGVLLDESWRNYLSLPRGVFSGHGVPTVESLELAIKRFEAVAADNRYKALLDRQEFQQLYGLLQTYAEQVRQVSQPAGTAPSANAGFPVRAR
jgi:lipid-binding SYLF domain-containing protein